MKVFEARARIGAGSGFRQALVAGEKQGGEEQKIAELKQWITLPHLPLSRVESIEYIASLC